MIALYALALSQEAVPVESVEARFTACVALANTDPKGAEVQATHWRLDGGKYFARECLGIAYANQGRWQGAAAEFTAAAREAEIAHDLRAGQYWAQAGNAHLASNQPREALAALDAALATGALAGLDLGEAQFDRGRALVLLGDNKGARADIDRALKNAAADPLIWLSSATLARRMDDLPRAKADIAEVFARASDDPSVMVEIGNIAASEGDIAGAKGAWGEAIEIAPNSEAAERARAALKQFDAPLPK